MGWPDGRDEARAKTRQTANMLRRQAEALTTYERWRADEAAVEEASNLSR